MAFPQGRGMRKEGSYQSILASLAIHALLAAWLITLATQSTQQQNTKSTYIIDLDPIVEKTKKKEDHQLKEKIVETQLVKPSKDVAQDAFLGRQTQVVEKQTASEKYQAMEKMKSEQQEAEREKVEAVPEIKKLAVGVLPKMKEQLQKQRNAERERNWASIGDSARDSVAKDYVKGLEEGHQTLLNTREYVFFSYFERIRKSLDSAWHPILRAHLEKIFRAGRHLANETDHTTKILVTLNEGGKIIRVQMVEESGTRDLDDAAIKAFNRAGPFPNPPKGIINASGTIEIRWDFILRT